MVPYGPPVPPEAELWSPRPVPHKPGFYLNLFRENMAACVTALKRSHDLENYGFDGLRSVFIYL